MTSLDGFYGFSEAAMHAAQEINPCNVDDAEYISGHPSDFTSEQVQVAHATVDFFYASHQDAQSDISVRNPGDPTLN